MRLTLVSLLALTLTPIASFAYGNKTVVEAYQETIQKLEVEYEKLKRKVAELENDANRIKALIAKYEVALGTTTLEKTVKLTDAISVKDGNVGIGTTPGVKLDVNGNIRLAHAESPQKKGIYSNQKLLW
jgi:predicted RNase H-like nuclease (RuvC/YqgF family)